MGNPILGTPNFIKSTFNTVVIGAGDWDTDSPLTNLRDPFYINNTISASKSKEDTRLQIDMGSNRDIKLFSIPNSDVSKPGLIRVQGAALIAWSNVTVDGVNIINATTLNIDASGQANINIDDIFTIASDTQVYQTTSALGLGENLFTRSEEINDADWTKTNVTIGNTQEAPDGEVSAEKVLEIVTSGVHSIEQAVSITSGTNYTVSFFVEANGRTKFSIDGADAGIGAGNNAAFDLTAVSVVDTGNTASTITNVFGTWFRCTTRFTAVASVSTIFTLLIADDGGSTSYVGDITKGLNIWGGQIVAGNNALDYVKTGSSTATVSGSITIERVDSDGVGLAIATTGSEVIITNSGNYALGKIADTGFNDYFPILFPIGSDVWGGPTVWDGKVTDEDLATLNLPRSFVFIFDIIVLGRYWKVEIDDETRVDDFVTIDAMYLASGFQPAKGMAFGSVQGLRSNSTKERSAGGIKITNEEPSERFVTANFINLTVDEGFVNIFDTQRQLDIGEPFFWVTDDADTTLMTRRAFDSEFENLDELAYTFFNNMEISLRIEEKLA